MCYAGSLRTATVSVVMFIQQHIMYSCQMCTVHAAGQQLLLSDVYSACSRKTAAVVGCVQQENSYYCRMCAGGRQLLLSDVYSRKTATVVGCVQKENSNCCQICTPGKQLLFIGVYIKKTGYCRQVCTAGK
jgi:hypothetical protein